MILHYEERILGFTMFMKDRIGTSTTDVPDVHCGIVIPIREESALVQR